MCDEWVNWVRCETYKDEAHLIVELGPLALELLREGELPPLVVREAQRIKVLEELFGRFVFDDATALKGGGEGRGEVR